jgi:hypothetical protein
VYTTLSHPSFLINLCSKILRPRHPHELSLNAGVARGAQDRLKAARLDLPALRQLREQGGLAAALQRDCRLPPAAIATLSRALRTQDEVAAERTRALAVLTRRMRRGTRRTVFDRWRTAAAAAAAAGGGVESVHDGMGAETGGGGGGGGGGAKGLKFSSRPASVRVFKEDRWGALATSRHDTAAKSCPCTLRGPLGMCAGRASMTRPPYCLARWDISAKCRPRTARR